MTTPSPVEALRHIAFEPLTDDAEASFETCLEEAVRIARAALPLAEKEAEVRATMLEALETLQWKSADRDNMEFTCRVTCYQMDKIRDAIKVAKEPNP